MTPGVTAEVTLGVTLWVALGVILGVTPSMQERAIYILSQPYMEGTLEGAHNALELAGAFQRLAFIQHRYCQAHATLGRVGRVGRVGPWRRPMA